MACTNCHLPSPSCSCESDELFIIFAALRTRRQTEADAQHFAGLAKLLQHTFGRKTTRTRINDMKKAGSRGKDAYKSSRYEYISTLTFDDDFLTAIPSYLNDQHCIYENPSARLAWTDRDASLKPVFKDFSDALQRVSNSFFDWACESDKYRDRLHEIIPGYHLWQHSTPDSSTKQKRDGQVKDDGSFDIDALALLETRDPQRKVGKKGHSDLNSRGKSTSPTQATSKARHQEGPKVAPLLLMTPPPRHTKPKPRSVFDVLREAIELGVEITTRDQDHRTR